MFRLPRIAKNYVGCLSDAVNTEFAAEMKVTI
jgi:hypothetical protein